MALLVEDGSIVPGAESYNSVAELDQYHLDRNNIGWTGTDAVKEAAARKATQYLEMKYGRRWKGFRVSVDQSLGFPRHSVERAENDVAGGSFGVPAYYPSTSIPKVLKEAHAECSIRFLKKNMAPDLGRGGAVKSVTVGPIRQEFMDGASATTTYPQVDMLLAPLVSSSGGFRLVRS